MYDETLDPSAIHVTYPYRIAHPLLRFLPMKLAQYIGDNFRKRLGIPHKQDKTRWSTEELNSILMYNLASEKIRHKRLLESRSKGAETMRRREARDGEQT